jgi:hypothetical protein
MDAASARQPLNAPRIWPRIWIVASAAVLVAIAFAAPPIAQPDAYHDFADRRALWGVPHFANVVSNLAFLAVAVFGLAVVFARRRAVPFANALDALPYRVFFVGIVAVAVGSTWYHLEPNTQTLFWDRLPIALAFLALLAAFIADRIHPRAGVLIMLPVLLAVGVAGTVYWRQSEIAGAGDLRFYFLCQALALLLIPLIAALFPGRLTRGRSVAALAAWYAGAVISEQFDGEIYDLLGHVLSGHSIKHLLAAGAIAMVALMLRRHIKTDGGKDEA